MQIADGAWGLTLSTLHQVRVARKFGIDRIVLANILVDRKEIATIYSELERHPGFDFYCLINSAEALSALVDCHAEGGWSRPIKVLVEFGYLGGRTGCRGRAAALDLARQAVTAGPAVQLKGFEGFEGLLHARTDDDRDARVRAFVEDIVDLVKEAEAEDMFGPGEVIVSAGGTAFLDLVLAALSKLGAAHARYRLVIRSGCYIAFDAGQYAAYFERMAKPARQASRP